MQRCPLTAPNRYPLAYPLEVLQGDTQAVCLRAGNAAFSDGVIDPGAKAPFLAPPLTQQPLGGTRAFGLQFRPQTPLPVAQAAQRSAAVAAALTVYGDVDHAQVYPKVVNRRSRCLLSDRATGVEVPPPVTVEQVALALAGLQQRAAALVGNEGDELAAAAGPDGDTCPMPDQDAIVVSNAAVGT